MIQNGRVFFRYFFCVFFFRPLSRFLLRKTLFSCGFSVISLSFAWFFLGKTLFSYGFRVISLGSLWSFVRKTLFSHGFRVISLDFQKENIRYLGYSLGKCYFPDIFAFFRFSTYVTLVIPRENPIFLTFSHFGRISCCSCCCCCCDVPFAAGVVVVVVVDVVVVVVVVVE